MSKKAQAASSPISATRSVSIPLALFFITTWLTTIPGSTLNTALRPVGAPLEKVKGPLGNAVGGITKPALGPLMGNKDERAEVVGGNNKDSYRHKEEKIAGKEQTGQNPLGLDQTGRWGFQD